MDGKKALPVWLKNENGWVRGSSTEKEVNYNLRSQKSFHKINKEIGGEQVRTMHVVLNQRSFIFFFFKIVGRMV